MYHFENKNKIIFLLFLAAVLGFASWLYLESNNIESAYTRIYPNANFKLHTILDTNKGDMPNLSALDVQKNNLNSNVNLINTGNSKTMNTKSSASAVKKAESTQTVVSIKGSRDSGTGYFSRSISSQNIAGNSNSRELSSGTNSGPDRSLNISSFRSLTGALTKSAFGNMQSSLYQGFMQSDILSSGAQAVATLSQAPVLPGTLTDPTTDYLAPVGEGLPLLILFVVIYGFLKIRRYRMLLNKQKE